MDNNENVKHFVESFVKFDENVKAAQEYIKETYNIDSTYSDEDDTIYIWTENLNENLNLAAAREYIEQEIGLELILPKSNLKLFSVEKQAS